ncbi:MAG: HIT family protein [Haliea sp.]|nr:MAG: HIT family protein [Haliea sp.]
MNIAVPGCVLCETDGGTLVFRNERLRVIHCNEAGFPAFYRVVWNAHCPEFSDLDGQDRVECMAAVAVVEQVLRDLLQPTKVNLAALGNMVPHLHWHVIARFDWDSHFPAPVWAAAQREAPAGEIARVAAAGDNVNRLIGERMAAL